MSAHERTGLLCAGLCALNGAFVPAVAKLTTNTGEPLLVAMLTTWFGAIAAISLLLWRGRLGDLFALAHLPGLLAIGTLGTGVAFFLFYSGASRSSAIEAVLCLQIEPAYSLILAWLALGHRPGARRVAATILLLAGIGLAVGSRDLRASPGLWFLLITPLAWQLSHLVVLRRLVGVAPDLLSAARYLFGGVVLTLMWLASGGLGTLPGVHLLLPQLPLLAVQGILLSYAGTLLWYGAVTRLDLARATAIVVPSIPLLSLLASFAVLGETPSWAQSVGMLLVAAGVMAFVTAPHLEGQSAHRLEVAKAAG